MFPFQHLGDVYYECTRLGGTEGIPWCGTQYMADDDEGTATDWGYCKLDGKSELSILNSKSYMID